MCKCYWDGCTAVLPDHDALWTHIKTVHGGNRISWKSYFVALALALLLVLQPVIHQAKPNVSWCPSCKEIKA